MNIRPGIGITMRIEHTTDRFYLSRHYSEAIEAATAWTTDGIIAALEDPRPDRFVLAVQWHPELGWKDDGLSQRLFKSFVNQASDVRESNLASLSTPA